MVFIIWVRFNKSFDDYDCFLLWKSLGKLNYVLSYPNLVSFCKGAKHKETKGIEEKGSSWRSCKIRATVEVV